MDFNELIPRLFADSRLSQFEKIAFVALSLAGGREGHVQNKTLGEIGEYVSPKISAASLSDAIGVLQRTGWITASKPSAKESWDIRLNVPVKGNVKTFEHRVKGAKVTVTVEEED